MKPDGLLEVLDRLPQVGFIVFEMMVASEQERLAGVRADATRAGEPTGFLGCEVRLNLLGDGSRDLGLSAPSCRDGDGRTGPADGDGNLPNLCEVGVILRQSAAADIRSRRGFFDGLCGLHELRPVQRVRRHGRHLVRPWHSDAG